MRTLRQRVKMSILALGALLVAMPLQSSAHASSPYTYDAAVLADQPVGYWTMAPADGTDRTGNGHNGTYYGGNTETTLPNGDAVVAFNGLDQYFEIPDHDQLELTTTGILTVEAWMRPDTLEFEKQQSSGYVHWMGKGEPGQHSWASRMYSYTNTEKRPNRISGYSFNLAGGLGAGSYFQDPVTAGEWIHYTLVINTVEVSEKYPTGYTKIYKNGVLRDQDVLAGYNIIPGNGTAPIRVGTRDFLSFFEGAVGKVAIYNYELSPEQLKRHHQVMVHGVTLGSIVNQLDAIDALAAGAALTEDSVLEAIGLYGSVQELLPALPEEVFAEQLHAGWSESQPVIIGMMEDFLRSLPPGSHYRIDSAMLEFLVDYSILVTGAVGLEDLGSVQGYVMSFVRSHATGSEVGEVIREKLQ